MNPGFISGKRKKFFGFGMLIAVVFSAFGLFLITAAATDTPDPQEIPDEIFIENTIYKTDRKGAVYFSHLEHAEGYVEACEVCHHDYQNGQNIWIEGQPVQKCSACHHPQKRTGNARKLNIAYHKNCKGCHQRLAKEGGTEAPYRQCTDCHEKR